VESHAECDVDSIERETIQGDAYNRPPQRTGYAGRSGPVR
jgi:hypothetical protein